MKMRSVSGLNTMNRCEWCKMSTVIMKTTIVSGLNRCVWGVLSNYEDNNCVRLEQGVCGAFCLIMKTTIVSGLNRGCVGRVV